MSSSRKGSITNPSVFVRHGDSRPAPPVGPRESEAVQRSVSGSMAHKPNEEDVRARRVSVSCLQGTSLRSSLAHGPVLDSARDSERGADAKGQSASTYAGAGAGAGRRQTVPSASTSRPQASESHSRPVTPDRPFKRARTADSPDARTRSHVSPTHEDRMVTSSPEGPSVPSEMIQRLEQEETGRDMTGDELLMFTSLSRVLVKKRDNDGWKCVLCRYVEC